MGLRTVFIAREDHERFFAMLERSRESLMEAEAHLRDLEFDVARARTVPAGAIPRNVVALYSWVRLRMSDVEHEITCQLVMPAEADARNGRISVLSPIGATIMGYRVGETVVVETHGRCREVTIRGVFHALRDESPGAEDEPARVTSTPTSPAGDGLPWKEGWHVDSRHP
jgi:regulator of nucleoside diphosphate kinase